MLTDDASVTPADIAATFKCLFAHSTCFLFHGRAALKLATETNPRGDPGRSLPFRLAASFKTRALSSATNTIQQH
jgi:hypothetical protein